MYAEFELTFNLSLMINTDTRYQTWINHLKFKNLVCQRNLWKFMKQIRRCQTFIATLNLCFRLFTII